MEQLVRSRLRLAGGGIIALVSLAMSLAAQEPPTFHAETRLVVLRVTVANRRGELVTDLDRQAFRVYENGRPQPVALFRREDVPVSLGLIIDNSGSVRSLRARVEAAALAFARASNPLDDVFVLNFADKVRIDVPFTNDVRTLEEGIARVDSIGGTAMRDALATAERYLRERASHDRRALLVITDGQDNASRVTAAQLRGMVEHSTTTIYAVRLPRRGLSGEEDSAGDELERLARATGGVARELASVSHVESVVLQIARQIRSEYTIAYAPTDQALDNTYRKVQVKVEKPGGLQARTRPGYWATPVPPSVR